jgi:hypothetical protein
VIQAVVSVVGDQGDGVRHITSGPLNIVFLVRGHLYLVAASSRAEPVAALRMQLHMLHQHLLVLVTGGERALASQRSLLSIIRRDLQLSGATSKRLYWQSPTNSCIPGWAV